MKKILRCTVLLVLATGLFSGCRDGSVTGIRIHNESGSPFDEVNIVPSGGEFSSAPDLLDGEIADGTSAVYETGSGVFDVRIQILEGPNGFKMGVLAIEGNVTDVTFGPS
jgi:hypothetical protein